MVLPTYALWFAGPVLELPAEPKEACSCQTQQQDEPNGCGSWLCVACHSVWFLRFAAWGREYTRGEWA